MKEIFSLLKKTLGVADKMSLATCTLVMNQHSSGVGLVEEIFSLLDTTLGVVDKLSRATWTFVMDQSSSGGVIVFEMVSELEMTLEAKSTSPSGWRMT